MKSTEKDLIPFVYCLSAGVAGGRGSACGLPGQRALPRSALLARRAHECYFQACITKLRWLVVTPRRPCCRPAWRPRRLRTAGRLPRPQTSVTRATLDNGLQVIIVRDPLAPVVTQQMTFFAGATSLPRVSLAWRMPRST